MFIIADRLLCCWCILALGWSLPGKEENGKHVGEMDCKLGYCFFLCNGKTQTILWLCDSIKLFWMSFDCEARLYAFLTIHSSFMFTFCLSQDFFACGSWFIPEPLEQPSFPVPTTSTARVELAVQTSGMSGWKFFLSVHPHLGFNCTFTKISYIL